MVSVQCIIHMIKITIVVSLLMITISFHTAAVNGISLDSQSSRFGMDRRFGVNIYGPVIQFFYQLLGLLCRLGIRRSCSGDGNTPTPTTSPIQQQDPSLLSINDFTYRGAYRLKDVGEPGTNFAVGTIAYNPKRNSLYIVGHAQYQTIGEFPIVNVSLLSTDTTTAVVSLPVSGNPIQNFVPVLDIAKGGNSNTYNPDGLNTITGLLYLPNKSGNGASLLFNVEDFYDTSPTATQTTGIIRDATQLSTTVVQGFYRMNGGAKSAGYMGKIPASVQSKFNNTQYYTGWSSVYSILSRYSLGPSLYTFDPYVTALPNVPPSIIKTKELMSYAHDTVPLGGFDDATEWEPCTSTGPFPPSSKLWNPLSRAVYAFFIPSHNTFVAISATAGLISGIGYKGTQENGNMCGGPCPYLLNDYNNYYWFYNIDDILNAKNVYDPIPYAYGIWNIPYDRNNQGLLHRILGGAINEESGLLYIVLEGAGKISDYDYPPLIVTYSLPS